jgi:A/G-specific adenine glycosylase
MIEVPSTPWTNSHNGDASSNLGWRDYAPTQCEWRPVEGQVNHTFTHFNLELDLVAGEIGIKVSEDMANETEQIWADPSELDGLALPTVMKKVVRLALSEDQG